jgi:preprotein translocase subunit YajC
MNHYENSKKSRRITSMLYLLVMAVIMTGTYLSQQQKAATQKDMQKLQQSDATPSGFADTPTRN